MSKGFIVLIALLFCGALLPCNALDVRNPALNPVKFLDPLSKEQIPLISNGKADFAIVLDQSSEAGVAWNRQSIHLAAKLLQGAFKNTAGADVPLVDFKNAAELEKYKYWLVLGDNQVSRANDVNVGSLPPEGFVVSSFKRGVIIAGKDGSLIPGSYDKSDRGPYRLNGTEWGAMDFIERFLGARFYFPGPGVIWPKVSDLTIAPVKYQDSPRFASRHYWNSAGEFGRDSKNWPKEWADFAPDWKEFFEYSRQSDATRFMPAHNPPGHLWARVHAKSKPELFYKDKYGKLWADPNDAMGTLFDISNKETARQYIEDCKRYYQTGWNEPWKGWYEPSCEYLCFGQTDLYLSIENERTKGLLDYSRGKFGVMADVNAQFYVWLAEIAQKELPGKKILGWAYADYRLPPLKKWNFPPNLDFTQCAINNVCMYGKDEIVNYDVEIMKAWNGMMKKSAGSYIYFLDRYGFPEVVMPEYLQIYLKKAEPYINEYLACDHGVLWSSNFMNEYLSQRLLWNPGFNLEAARNEAYNLLYGGKAAPFISKFNQIIFKRWKENYLSNVKFNSKIPEMIHVDTEILYQKAFPPQIIKELENLLNEAMKAVPAKSIEQRRLEYFVKQWEKNLKQAKDAQSFTSQIYKVKKVSGNVKLDGRVDDPAWKNANVIDFRDAKSGEAAKSSGTGRMLWNNDGIYLAFEFKDDKVDKLSRKATARDGNVWDDDCVEVFLSPGEQKAEYGHVGANAAGIVADGHRRFKPDPTAYAGNWNWDGMECASAINAEGWTVELFLPFRGMNVSAPEPYSIWYGNFIRNKTTEPAVSTSFSRTMGNNHNLALFAMLKFMGRGD